MIYKEDLNDYNGYLTDSDMKPIAEEIGDIMIEEFGNEPEIDSQKKADEIEDTFKSLCMRYSYEEENSIDTYYFEISEIGYMSDGYYDLDDCRSDAIRFYEFSEYCNKFVKMLQINKHEQATINKVQI